MAGPRVEAVAADTPFFDLGADSLSLMSLAREVGAELGCGCPSARCSTRSTRRASWPISFRPRLVGPPSPPRPPNPVERSSPAGPPRPTGRGSPPTCGTSSHASSR
ncbi:acyl carrier protein [Saccharothrix coeruleofusca]|uniref:acyl carrier protein n=1 Tax=Saccharothrix coeruleofusca TaxID=33919 RepID=UPI003557B196